MRILKNLFAAVALFASMATAQAVVVNGNLNNAGYDTLNIYVSTSSIVDVLYSPGNFDAAVGLFDSSGNLIVFGDDADGSVYPHLTVALGAGNYSLLVTSCCEFTRTPAMFSFAFTDGFNSGVYYFSSEATLAGISAHLNSVASDFSSMAYQLTLTNADLAVADVPEPGSLALFAASIGALGLARRRRQARRV